MIISLLGRLAFPEEKLVSLIQKNAKKPEEIVKAYNLCKGDLTITQIAKKSGISQPALSGAIEKWQNLGIIMIDSNLKKGFEQKPHHLYEVNSE